MAVEVDLYRTFKLTFVYTNSYYILILMIKRADSYDCVS